LLIIEVEKNNGVEDNQGSKQPKLPSLFPAGSSADVLVDAKASGARKRGWEELPTQRRRVFSRATSWEAAYRTRNLHPSSQNSFLKPV